MVEKFFILVIKGVFVQWVSSSRSGFRREDTFTVTFGK